MKKHIKSVLALFSVCAAVAILLAVTNYFTAPIIKDNENANANQALTEVLGGATEFETLSLEGLPASIEEAYKADNGGYAFKVSVDGFGGKISIMCGINPDGTISVCKTLSQTESKGYGEKCADEEFYSQFSGKNTDNYTDVIIAGATVTTKAYQGAVKDALNAFAHFTGGTVDNRTEEEILADNLNAALPAANGSFSTSYLLAKVANADTVYVASNGSGYVFVVGDTFIGADKDGKLLCDASSEIAANIVKAITCANTEMLDLDAYGKLPSALIEAAKGEDGSYSLVVRASGFGITGDKYYSPSGKHVIIFLNINADGSVTECKTLFQAESAGYGAECENEEFYSQFNGKDQTNYTEVDAISGATVTTKAYLKAIERAFEAFEILKGGAEQ